MEKKIRTQELEIVNDRGEVRAVLKAGENGGVVFKMATPENLEAVSIAVLEDGFVTFQIANKNGYSRLEITAPPEADTIQLALVDGEEKVRAKLLLTPENVKMQLNDRSGEGRLMCHLDKFGRPDVVLWDEEGNIIGSLERHKDQLKTHKDQLEAVKKAARERR